MPPKVAAKYTADRTITGDLQKIRADLALVKGRIFSPCWGLREIKREVRRIECAVFNHDTGLAEIKTEVSAMAAQVSELAASAATTFLTTGPFEMLTGEEEILFMAINYSNATQTVTFTVHDLRYGGDPCLMGRVETVSAGPCCYDLDSMDDILPGHKEILAQLSSRSGVHIYAHTLSPSTQGDVPVQRFYSSMWQPVGTMCL